MTVLHGKLQPHIVLSLPEIYQGRIESYQKPSYYVKLSQKAHRSFTSLKFFFLKGKVV